ncbi:hypothetical protein [Sporolactobacillus terrae]|uniref:Uncharacterized protein n=1 Tax=Sporolactobacillus terrae TaxID=269673 RepID=A0A5K7WXF9_9BACL|nr:hypothetical protein [Sporolactobacillus terrae]BBN99285.1 hypothetical protein St703_19900 [Sporolactobacillus terrae]
MDVNPIQKKKNIYAIQDQEKEIDLQIHSLQNTLADLEKKYREKVSRLQHTVKRVHSIEKELGTYIDGKQS